MSSSSESSNSRRGRCHCVGIPRKCCSCDSGIMSFMSHSKANPNRMFFRCSTAASLKLRDDNHTFKWVDEGVDEEVVKMVPLFERLQSDVCEVRTEVLGLQQQLHELKKTIKLGCGAIVVGCLFVAAMFKFT